ncbi:MAG: NUDIX hydrolase [Patescibacteria group bacterium]|nr:NUDIX hydrolase [Patescibacteria group bacterium]
MLVLINECSSVTCQIQVSFEQIRKKVPMLTVDGIIIKNGKILLIKRAISPYKDHWALPGGFVELNETLEEAVAREVREETCLETKPVRLTGAYSEPGRDPRGHTISIAYLLKTISGAPKKTKEAKDVRFFALDNLPENMAFDHEKIINGAKEIKEEQQDS